MSLSIGISLNLRVQGNLIDPQFKIFQLSFQLSLSQFVGNLLIAQYFK